MSNQPSSQPDAGTITQWTPATGWFALFAIPTPPYYRLYHILFWVLIRRNGTQTPDALVSVPTVAQPLLLSECSDGALGTFVAHTNLDLDTDSRLSQRDAEGRNVTSLGRLVLDAMHYGAAGDPEHQYQSTEDSEA